jgi:hypothetical protein
MEMRNMVEAIRIVKNSPFSRDSHEREVLSQAAPRATDMGHYLSLVSCQEAFITRTRTMCEVVRMKGPLTVLITVTFYLLPLLALTGCFCGQFFRGDKDVVAVSISPTGSSILPGGTQQFTATGTFGGTTGGTTGDVTAETHWTSSNPGIVTINGNGLAKGIALGKVTITGNCDCYVEKASLAVSTQAVTLASIIVTPVSPSVGVGQTQQFTATGHYTDGSTNTITSSVTWTSSSATIATINSSGVATTVAAGNTTITASSGNISGNTILTVS